MLSCVDIKLGIWTQDFLRMCIVVYPFTKAILVSGDTSGDEQHETWHG